MLTKFLIAFLALIAISNGAPNKIMPKMIGGTETVIGEFPSTVAIFTPIGGNCVGVILNQNHVITSAQCIHDANRVVTNPSWLRIVAGDLNINVPSYRRFTTNVAHFFIHPNYSPSNNDLAILRVGSPFPFPHNTIDVAIRNTRVFPPTTCRYAGWGATTQTGTIDSVQRSINVPILNRDECNAPTVHNGRVLENMICAGSIPSQNVGVCRGNLGGGLFCHNELTGILSFGIGCGAPNQPGVYMQVRHYRDWIDSTFTSNNFTRPGVTV